MRTFLIILLLALVFLSQTINAKPNSREDDVSSSKSGLKEKKPEKHDDDDEDDDHEDDDDESDHIKSRLNEMKKKLESRTHITKVKYVTPATVVEAKKVNPTEEKPQNKQIVPVVNQTNLAHTTTIVNNQNESNSISIQTTNTVDNGANLAHTETSNNSKLVLDVPSNLVDILLERIRNEFRILNENRSLLVFLVSNNSTEESSLKVFETKKDALKSLVYSNNSLNSSNFVYQHHHELEKDQNVTLPDAQLVELNLKQKIINGYVNYFLKSNRTKICSYFYEILKVRGHFKSAIFNNYHQH